MKKVFFSAIFVLILTALVFTLGRPIIKAENISNPRITSISPSPVYVTDEGTELTINGEGFRELSDCGNAFIAGDGNRIDALSWSDTRIVVKLIKNKPLGIGQHQIVVKSCLESTSFPLLVKQAVCNTEEDWACTGWGSCSMDGVKTRTCTQEYACDSVGTPPTTTQTCTPSCTQDIWSCGDWATCSVGGTQTRTCTKISECAVVDTPSPTTSQSCTAIPSQKTPTTPVTPQTTCTEDTWSCNDWGSCSANGVQTRSCRRTFDCTSVETAPPEASKICQSQYQQQQSIPESPQSVSTDLIKATVKLACPFDESFTSYSQGSGTVIDPAGTILTNSHVVQGTIGCAVGFINDPSDDSVFSEVAFVTKISSTEDVALLKIDNKNRKTFSSVNIYNGDAKNLKLGDKIKVLGYPDYGGGSNLTYTSGDFSGFGSRADGLGNYLKTNAILEHGNSGGGAYTSNDTFIGIPTLVIRGELNAQSYLLSINTIKNWSNSTPSGVSSTQQRTGLTVSSLIGMVDNESEDLEAPDLSNTRVIIYGDKSKQQMLPNSQGQKQAKNKPLFQIDGVDSGSGITGYYVYFGSNINADPVKKGKLTKKATYSPPTITKRGVYYFIFKVKDKAGKISNSYITEYRYKK